MKALPVDPFVSDAACPLSDEVRRLWHAFSDKGRKDRVLLLARRVSGMESCLVRTWKGDQSEDLRAACYRALRPIAWEAFDK